MKKTAITLLLAASTLCVSASSYHPYSRNTNTYNSTMTNFERGFSTAVHAMERELEMVLSEQHLFEIDNKYIVYLDIGNMPIEHILVAKNYMIKEGFYPITTKHKLIIDGVDRKADAKQIIKMVKNKYFPNKKIHYKRNSTKVYTMYDHVFRDIIKKLRKEKCASYDIMLKTKSSSRF